MGKIEQTFAWSDSRVKTLRECMQRYFFHYYLSWNGWFKNAPPEKRSAYILKNLTNIYMWAGSIAHNEIESIVKEIRSDQKCRNLSQAQANIVQAFKSGWVQSKQKKWEQDPKRNINLAEHYYNEDIDNDKWVNIKNKMLKCIQAFYDSKIFQMMHEIKQDAWLALEDFQSFHLKTGEKVAVKIDCGFRYDGKIFLFDWKTGKINSSAIDQLITYSMHAIKSGWTKRVEDIVIVPVFLAFCQDDPENAIPRLSVSMDQIKHQTTIIQEESKILAEAHENRDNPDFFKHTDNPLTCERCNFRGICSGAETVIPEGDTPF